MGELLYGDGRLSERFWVKVYPCPLTGCWFWGGRYDHVGKYGRWTHRAHAYRVTYETLVGAVAPGLHLDHLCRMTQCVNPNHLEPVTPGENTRRHYFAQTHCSRGHEFDETNTRWTSNPRHPGSQKRVCRKCVCENQMNYKRRRRARLVELGQR